MLFDIEHCFQSIQWQAVYSCFRDLNYSKEINKYLTGLCTHQLNINEPILEQLDSKQKELITKRHLPLGAPSSPTLSNLVLRRLDKRLAGLAKSLHMAYSRYADDLAFSTDNHRDWAFFEPLIGAILPRRRSHVKLP